MNKDKKFTKKEMQEVEQKVFYNLRNVTKCDNSFSFSNRNIVNEYNKQQKENTKNLFF